MGNIIFMNDMMNDNSLWLAIIAINMTIIGLTSLAETKKIIGIDYGKYLIKHYKVIGIVRIYYLLIIFACINIVSLITMFIKLEQVRSINLIVLLLSLIFAIYYFFSFILIENSNVKNQLIKDEILGMYYKSGDDTNFKPDLLVGMSKGWRTEKRLSSNIISYFDSFNIETQKSFEELFGPNSILYSQSKSIKRHWEKKYNLCAYDYNSKYGFMHISHEFFQLFRYTDLQEKWILEILRLFNKKDVNICKEYKMDNLIRILGHLNTFGKCEQIYKYKFIEYLESYMFDALEKKVEVIEKEKYLIKEFTRFILTSLEKSEDIEVYRVALVVFKKLTNSTEFFGSTTVNSNLKLIVDISKDFRTDLTRTLMTDLYNAYLQQDLDKPVELEEIKKILKTDDNTKSNWISVEMLYYS